MTNPHEHFRQHLAAHLLRVLPEEEDARLLEHASECALCGALLTRLEQSDRDWWADTEHLPVTVLGTFHKDPDALAPHHRVVVESHLRECEACRDDLAELAGTQSKPALEHPAPEGRRPDQHSALPGWLLGAVVGSLATAAGMLILVRPATTPSPAPPPTESSRAPLSEPRASGEIRSQGPIAMQGKDESSAQPRVGQAVFLRGQDRSAGSETTLVRVVSGLLVPLRPPLLEAPARRVRILVQQSDGSLIEELRMSGRAWVERGLLLDPARLDSGALRLQVEWVTEDGVAQHRVYPIRLEKR